ncbi:MAG: signal recognition particle receptor subunit alpha, partial [Gaiellales bacterium]
MSEGWDDAFLGFGGATVATAESGRGGGWFSRLRENLKRSSRALAAGIAEVAFDPQDVGVWERLEEALLLADVGVPATVVIIEKLEAEAAAGRLQGAEALSEALREIVSVMLETEPEARRIDVRARPAVILLVGVNGTGKTTTIGKLAYRLHEAGASVVIGAADTFRAAAAEQLETWAS